MCIFGWVGEVIDILFKILQGGVCRRVGQFAGLVGKLFAKYC